MAYSTNNTTNTISVTNFGAVGNGIQNSRGAIQQAIDFFQSKGLAGTVYVPRGNYLCSGQLVITGDNITLRGEPGANLQAFDENDFRKITVTGMSTGRLVSGVSILNLSINGGRSSSTTEVYDGVINLHNTKNTTIQDCSIGNFLGIGVFPQFNNENVDVLNNRFYEYHLGIFNDGRVTGCGLKYLTVDNNIFDRSWYQPEKNYFSAIKIQAPEIYNPCFGHRIVNNKIYLPSLLGIELWGYVQNSIVADNYIESGVFGISIANHSRNIIVDSNAIKDTTLYGIEVAESDNVIVSDNSVCGNRRVRDAIIINSSNNTDVVGNSVNGFTHAGITTYNSTTLIENLNIVGNVMVQSGMHGVPFYFQGGNFINFSENTVKCEGSGTYFVMIDYDAPITYNGLTIARNDFAGSVTDWGILFYAGSSTGSIENCLIEGNRTYGVESCGYGMLNYTDYLPTSFTARDNFGQTGAIGYYIPDIQYPAGGGAPYGTTDIENAFTYYGSSSWAVPASGITGNGAWLCVWSGGIGAQNNVRISARNYFTQVANQYNAFEIWATMSPYETPYAAHTLYASPFYSKDENVPIYKRVKTVSHPTQAENSVWLQLAPLATGASGQLFYFKYSQENNLVAPVASYVEPVDTQNNANLYLDNNRVLDQAYKYSYGLGIGNSAGIYSLSSGNLTVTGNTTVQGNLTADNYKMVPTTLSSPANIASASGRLTLNFSGLGLQTVVITGGTVISGTNYFPGAALTVRLFATTPSQPLAWAPWTFIGAVAPTGLTTAKTAILSLQCFDTTDTGVVAAYSVQP